jgi:hypothetical protein
LLGALEAVSCRLRSPPEELGRTVLHLGGWNAKVRDDVRQSIPRKFLDAKKAASRRRNNLRSEIITLFRYAQIRLRALHRDRKTEAELVLRDQTKRKPVETFSPKEFQTFLGAVRPEWLAWLALGGLAGIRTDGEIFRITWECFKWDRRIIDLSTTMTKIDERRHVPLCDRLIDLLMAVLGPARFWPRLC